ncbi:hypothetical protein BN7_2664 [Wickerhamomyces ciferrii]|uniref:VPS4-associated protein 1 n=1 Tax=Wickerhamomyces ciferrii (strain ATCC 14091 / BCRC 22168 / CBS 111 / JCM 3599 / NBRC 0793 / NRRL Y-1031 F-60-10) TaxID=1206466 RepID=K0KLM5_WICCF|nr:uncharacterized protein BN7_2664 [Wickerhamomyces ciferrii]CCH43117.1 hypothetical protein BN7_2664 [Wickerhamomyces ciferrii]
MPPFNNLYHLRKVSQQQSKPCNFCYKPTTTVLITSDGSSDFFYTCDSHLKDQQFAIPQYDEEYNKAKIKKQSLDKEIQQLKLKWDEQQKYKPWDNLINKFSSKKEDAEKKKDKDKDSPESKINELNTELSNHNDILSKPPRIYKLNESIYKIRLNKKLKNKVQAQETAELNAKLNNPSFFPSVPNNKPGA